MTKPNPKLALRLYRALSRAFPFESRCYRRLGLRNLLVLYQVAGSLSLLLLTGFLVLGFQKTTGMQVGFDPRNLYLVSLDPIRDGYTGDQAADFFQKLLERVKRLPSVTSATLTDTVPMSSNGNPSVTFTAVGSASESSRLVGSAHKYVVGKDYLDTLGIPIRPGGRCQHVRPGTASGRPAPVGDPGPAGLLCPRPQVNAH